MSKEKAVELGFKKENSLSNDAFFVDLAKKSAEYYIRQNDVIFEKDLCNGFTSIDNIYINFLKNKTFTQLARYEETKYIILIFRLITEKGKLKNIGHVNFIDFETNEVIEVNLANIDCR